MGKARSLNPVYNVNAILGKKEGINAPNVYFAVKEGYDGYSMVSVSSLPTVELFIGQGTTYQTSITEWTLFNSQETYGGVGANAFARLPNLKKITIWQEDNDSPLTIDDNAFYSNVELEHIYVHPDLLAAYQTKFSGKSFVSLFEAYELIQELTVPTQFDGNFAPTTLTKAWLDLVFANMPSVERNSKTTLIVPSYFTGIDVSAFNDLGTRFVNLEELKCNGAKTFASGFMNGASWCKHLWLDNGTSTLTSPYCTDNTTIYANFRVVAPYLVFANYFMQEHNIKTNVVCPIIGYHQFSANAELPQTSPTGEYLWFSNIDCNTDYNSPTGLENDPSFIDDYEATTSDYYYCYDKTEILVIQGSGTLTSAIVEASIQGLDTPLSWITEIVVPQDFTSVENGALNSINTYLPSTNLILRNYSNAINYDDYFSQGLSWYTYSASSTDCHIKTIIDMRTEYSNKYMRGTKFFNAMYLPNMTILDTISRSIEMCNPFDLFAPKLTSFPYGITSFDGGKSYIPKATNTYIDGYANYPRKIFINNKNCSFRTNRIQTYSNILLYTNAKDLAQYKEQADLVDMQNYIIGIIDGNNTYQELGILKDTSFDYPKLTGIDTEANIQLLTPADDSLYLASDTGNLWQYNSGVWVNVFGNDYAGGATWYSNEDCTTTVLPSAMDTTHTYYCKLVWNNPTLTINAKQGETTLTSAIVTRELAKASSNKSVVTKVIIPIDFTAYDSGTITAIQNYGFTNLRYLETCYEAGAMTIDFEDEDWQEVITKITSIGKTLDEALVYARTLTSKTAYGSEYAGLGDANLIIFPPMNIVSNWSRDFFGRCGNLVYVAPNSFPQSSSGNAGLSMFGFCGNLIKIDNVHINNIKNANSMFSAAASLKEINMTFTNFNESITTNDIFAYQNSITSMKLNGWKANIDITRTHLDRNGMVEFFNSIGTPTTTKTITMGSAKLSLLTADDIAIATAKNWVLE